MRKPYASFSMLHNSILRKITALFLIFSIQLSVNPPITFGSSGPKQPEYLGYESEASPEMINPLTGDFTYNIPLLHVPGPEGGFSLPLTYRAGVKLEDEASWVGLGWSLNPGAIVRTVNNYPDDAWGEISTYRSVNNDSNINWSGKIPSIQDQAIKAETSFRGTMQQIADGVARQFVLGLLANPMLLLVASIYEYIDSNLNQNENPSEPTFDFEKKDAMYGPLYFGFQYEWQDNNGIPYNYGPNYYNPVSGTYKAPVFKNLSTYTPGNLETDQFQAIASDVHRHVFPPVSSQHDVAGQESFINSAKEPISIAYDNYQVMGLGVSGQIKPYRLETGSVCPPSYLTYRYPIQNNYALHYKYNVIPFLSDYKVGFRYENYPTNNYTHHTFNTNQTGATGNSTTISLTDSKLYNQSSRTETSRKGLIINQVTNGYKRSLIQGKHVEWYANSELQNPPSGFIECPESSNGNQVAGPNQNMRANNPKRIGAFSVTAENGTTYHYSLPVYSFGSKTVRQHSNNPYPAQLTTFNYNETPNSNSFAQAWLLTAITGPDYVDKGQLGKIDKEDLGYWVKMEYGRYNDYFDWRKPYMYPEPTPMLTGYRDFDNSAIYSYSQGTREGYYLNAIKTRTHTALFIKEERSDALANSFSSLLSLKLSEIILLKNENLDKLTNGLDGNTPSFGLNTNNNASNSTSTSPRRAAAVYDMKDINAVPAIQNYIYSNMVRRIVFSYDYSLCPGNPNSASGKFAGNKLTLKNVKTYLAGNILENAGYKFDYGDNNPIYNLDKYDAFGYYKSNGGWSDEMKKPSSTYWQADQDGAAWSIKHIVNPLGSSITVHYERDTYSRISEIFLTSDKPGDGIRVKRIDLSDGNTQYSTRYFYTEGPGYGRSTGVVTKEPSSYKNTGTPNFNAFDYPATPVLYSKVTALTGPFINDINNFDAKTEYYFYTPESTMLSVLRNTSTDNTGAGGKLTNVLNTITVNTGLIGQPKAIYKYNKHGELEVKSIYNYSTTIPRNTNNNLDQGKFTESTIAAEYFQNEHVFTRTIKTFIPTVLTSITITHNNITSTNTNEVWDFFTSKVLETSSTSSTGIIYWNKKNPAYEVISSGQNKKYPEMGLKGENSTYKNMLVQEAANYTFKKSASGSMIPLHAQIQSWKKDWNSYREFNSVTWKYEDSNNGPQVWRSHQTFDWNANPLNSDGTISNFIDFNWSQQDLITQNPNWVINNEVTRYDNYSKVLEIKDINNSYHSIKNDQANNLSIASINNAKYTETAYSGAEDGALNQLAPYNYVFGGEIKSGGLITDGNAHSGKYSIRIGQGEPGFTYQATIGSEIRPQKYRAAVWTLNNAGSAIRLVAKACNGSTCTEIQSINSGHTNNIEAGGWKLLNLVFEVTPAQAGQTLVVTCENSAPTYLFIDDFRFHPIDAPLVATNYDPITWQPTYTLNNDNLFTQIEYNIKYKPRYIYKEVANSGKIKAKEFEYNDAPHKVYYNTPITGSFSKKCPPSSTPSPSSTTYTLPAGRVSSEFSQQDAQDKAQPLLTQEGQSYANNTGSCNCKPNGTVLYYECETHHSGVCKRYAIKVVNNPTTGYCGTIREEVPALQTQGPCDPNVPCDIGLE
ncbi:hypothetical protein I5M27_08610 [Adhaeribacter sp. BT258]|uniref:DUF5977 domain-containing protein n=1 Tax=Adhaeribacter terrigena TaxID=2793070 RepID=A0ABS1C0V4_9BACT|nr:DUF5977 domain-containing protein [Adhaeribacter terrigena]MBK0403047.1 hypothetical protein [Adhaeribacter terrigena]